MIFIIVIIILSADQLTKYLIQRALNPLDSLPLINGILHLTLVRNTGAAFGLFRNQVPLFIFTAMACLVLIYLQLRDKGQDVKYKIALGLICAGALGNLIDRVFLGYVVDFIDLRVWPVFNIADSSITIGAVLLGWNIFFNSKVKTRI